MQCFHLFASVLALRSIHHVSFGRHSRIGCVSTDNMAFRCNAVFYLDAAVLSALYVCLSGVPTRTSSYTWQNGFVMVNVVHSESSVIMMMLFVSISFVSVGIHDLHYHV